MKASRNIRLRRLCARAASWYDGNSKWLGGAYVTVTTVLVQVKPDFIGAFIESTRENHRESRKEPGNLRFDVLQNKNDPSRFLLYEAYESEEAAAEHKRTPHYLKWRAAVEPWMARSREGIAYQILCPADRSGW